MTMRISPSVRPASSLDAYLTTRQRENQSSGSAAAIAQANDEALQAAIAASMNDEDSPASSALPPDWVQGGLTNLQIRALESQDAATIAIANDDALAEGILQSLEDPASPEKAVRSSIPEEELDAQRELTAKLKEKLQTLDIHCYPNTGHGNNCLIISMLQHATGEYHSEHTEKANAYRDLLVRESHGTERTGVGLYSDNRLARWLINKINQDYFQNKPDKQLAIQFVTAGPDGGPAVRQIGEGECVVAIADLVGHYEAMSKPV